MMLCAFSSCLMNGVRVRVLLSAASS